MPTLTNDPAMPAVPLVAHLIYRLDFGGLETLLVERINRMRVDAYRHAIVCLDGFDERFAARIARPGVALVELGKRPGLSLATHLRLGMALRRLRPTILHTYNLSAVEYAPVAALAGVPVRINGAHGRDAGDPAGTNRRHNLLRRMMAPFYDCCYANSAAMLDWNRTVIGVPEEKSCLLPNGIDTDAYCRPLREDDGCGPIVIGTVGRIDAVKDHPTLVEAFMLLRERLPQLRDRLRLAIVGDGAALPELRALVAGAGIARCCWLPGSRADIGPILAGFRVFAVSSIAEGMPTAVLEAMASGLPVAATAVGGVPELVEEGVTGHLAPASSPRSLANAIEPYLLDAALAARHGAAGREKVVRCHSMAAMVAAYESLYNTLCERKLGARGRVASCVE